MLMENIERDKNKIKYICLGLQTPDKANLDNFLSKSALSRVGNPRLDQNSEKIILERSNTDGDI